MVKLNGSKSRWFLQGLKLLEIRLGFPDLRNDHAKQLHPC